MNWVEPEAPLLFLLLRSLHRNVVRSFPKKQRSISLSHRQLRSLLVSCYLWPVRRRSEKQQVLWEMPLCGNRTSAVLHGNPRVCSGWCSFDSAISSAAICAALGLTGLAGGAAVAGCCAQMIGFAVMSFKENKWGGLFAQGIGTSMLQMGNIVKNPKIWIAPIVTSAITGPVATCLSIWNEWCCCFFRYGHLRSGWPDRCIHRLGQRCF